MSANTRFKWYLTPDGDVAPTEYREKYINNRKVIKYR